VSQVVLDAKGIFWRYCTLANRKKPGRCSE